MPIGTHHVITGLLSRDGIDLALDVDGGGRWHLDPWAGSERLIDRRVTVTGKRCGFDCLSAEHVELA